MNKNSPSEVFYELVTKPFAENFYKGLTENYAEFSRDNLIFPDELKQVMKDD